MALDGPYFSHLLLLAFYLSGLRFSPNMSQQDREERSARYMKIVMTMVMEELSKPCSIPTARKWAGNPAHTRGPSDFGGKIMLCR